MAGSVCRPKKFVKIGRALASRRKIQDSDGASDDQNRLCLNN